MSCRYLSILLVLPVLVLGQTEETAQHSTGPINLILAAPSGLLAINFENKTFYAPATGEGESRERLEFLGWPGFHHLTVTPRGSLWGLKQGLVHRRVGITEAQPLGTAWELVPGPRMADLSAGAAEVCALDLHGHLLCRAGTEDDPTPSRSGTHWRRSQYVFQEARQLVVGRRSVYVVDSTLSVHVSPVDRSVDELDFQSLCWAGTSQLSLSPSDHPYVIGNLDRAVYARLSPTDDPADEFWHRVSDQPVALLTVGSTGLWAVSPDNQVLYFPGYFGATSFDVNTSADFTPI